MPRRSSGAPMLCFLLLAVASGIPFLLPQQLSTSPARTLDVSNRHAEALNLSKRSSELLAVLGIALLARPLLRHGGTGGSKATAVTCRAEGTAVAPSAEDTAVVSPFDGKSEAEQEDKDSKLPLTWENVEKVLDEVRPFLINDGGNVKIVEIDGPLVKLELVGACSSCSASETTMKMGIEQKLRERIPEIEEVVSVSPEQEPLTNDGIEEVLDGIRPFLSVSGGSINVHELVEGEEPQVVLKMIGPPLKSMAVRVEIQNRIRKKYPLLSEVTIVGEDGKPPAMSA